MHGTLPRHEPLNGALLFNSADDMLAAMFGAPQHDHHVKTRGCYLRTRDVLADYERREDAVAQAVQDIIGRMRAGRI